MNERYTPEDRPRTGNDFELNHPTIVALLHLLGVVTGGLANLVAVVLAYMWKDDAQAPWMRSHYSFHIRTFWYALLLSAIGVVLALVLIGFVILALVGIYVAVRSVLALMAAQRREPIRNPDALLW